MLTHPSHEDHRPAQHPPIFNIPGPVLVLLAILLAIHAVRIFLLSPMTDATVLGLFGFMPAVFDGSVSMPYAPLSRIVSPLTYGLLHGDWVHLAVNCGYLAAFATPVARRFGAVRFTALMVAGTLGGAIAHLAAYPGEQVLMIGASAAVSAAMGAAVRFALEPGYAPARNVHRPALSLVGSLKNRGALAFVAVWFLVNWLFGSGIVAVGGEDVAIAWQAHIGGFLVGWLGFAVFDPVPRSR